MPLHAFLRILLIAVFTIPSFSDDRVNLRVDTSEAEAVLAILRKQHAREAIISSDWQRVFNTEPYQRLKKREAKMKRALTDDDFKKFVLSPELAARAGELRRTLTHWSRANLVESAQRVLAYLPADARIRAKVYPTIKPRTNSFVFEVGTDPAIFLYLDPAVTQAQFENTVAHELHHIGFASVKPTEMPPDTPAPLRDALGWMGAFGEGFAMLAAAGSVDIHPHAASKPEDRARWDRDLANFNQDLRTLEKFFLQVIDGGFSSKEEEQKVAYSFFGTQGPWYTVGYKMAVTIERSEGRAALIDAMRDPRRLLILYNQAAAQYNRGRTYQERLAQWSAVLLEKIDVPINAKRQMP
ncbi:MAG: hypothetical protein L0Z53_27075 [Acidobacteriales bacterium]|nr:hypothetical protein [Terriglobales bacterium]